jgi:hypothetical protein
MTFVRAEFRPDSREVAVPRNALGLRRVGERLVHVRDFCELCVHCLEFFGGAVPPSGLPLCHLDGWLSLAV